MTILLIILIDNSLNSRIILTLFQVVVFIFFATKIFYFATKFLELVANLRLNFFFSFKPWSGCAEFKAHCKLRIDGG